MPGEALLQELLFGIQNPTNEQLFIERCATLFAKDDSKAWIDLYQPRITPPVEIRVPVDNTSTAAGPSLGAATTQRVGDDIEYDQVHLLRTSTPNQCDLPATLDAARFLATERRTSTN